MKTRIWICVVLTVALAACAHTGSKAPTSFNVAMPEGWRSIDTEEPMLFLTKDGGYKQFVLIRERPLTEPVHLQQTVPCAPACCPKRRPSWSSTRSPPTPTSATSACSRTSPARIAGHNGFRLTFLYTDVDGFVFKTIYYGFIKGNTFYNIRYGATEDPTKRTISSGT